MKKFEKTKALTGPSGDSYESPEIALITCKEVISTKDVISTSGGYELPLDGTVGSLLNVE